MNFRVTPNLNEQGSREHKKRKNISFEEHLILSLSSITAMRNLAANVKNRRKLVSFHRSSVFALVPRYTTHVIKVRIWPHVGEVCEPIGHGKESGNGGDVPGVLAVKAVFLQSLEMLLRDGVAATHGHRKVQHGALSRRQVCVVIINDHLGATRGEIT